MKYSAKEAADLKAALDSITPDHSKLSGICSTTHVHMLLKGHPVGTDNLQAHLTAQWPLYSGDLAYPLPGGLVAYYNNEYRGAAARREYMWNRNTSQYAELRWQLIEYLRAQCAAIILRRIADMLHGILNTVVEQRTYCAGICGVVDRAVLWPSSMHADRTDIHRTLKDLFEQWPEFSGSHTYPVCTVYQSTEDEARMQYVTESRAYSMWEGEYGAARMRLLQFMIEQTRPE